MEQIFEAFNKMLCFFLLFKMKWAEYLAVVQRQDDSWVGLDKSRITAPCSKISLISMMLDEHRIRY